MDVMDIRRGLMISVKNSIPNINGKKFDCGTFSFENDTFDPLVISHNLEVYPEALFVWVYNFPKNPGGNGRAMIGGIKFTNFDDSANAGFAHTANNNYNFGVTSTAFAWSATSSAITILTNSTYPWKAGYTYQWLAIGGDINA